MYLHRQPFPQTLKIHTNTALIELMRPIPTRMMNVDLNVCVCVLTVVLNGIENRLVHAVFNINNEC